jgi:hypothetical protein
MSRAKKRVHTRARPGRPPIHDERWSKVSVVLFDRQIVELDQLLNDIRRKSRKAINRASLIRALIDALFASGIDLSSATSEADLRSLLSLHDPSSPAAAPRPRHRSRTTN